AAIDVVLERLAVCPDVLAIRMLAADENAAALAPAVRALTLPEQRRAFRERTLEGARQARRLAEETCQRRQCEQTLWPQLTPLAERHAPLRQRLDVLTRRLAAVPGEVQREASGLPLAGKGVPSGPFAAEL